MANRNGRGPEEKGPKTGRGLGSCDSIGLEANEDVSRGCRRGRGGCGMGLRQNRKEK